MPFKYDKYGLRRDKNLSDVQDASLALTNILNDLALPGQTFIDKDLLVINNLAQTNVQAGDFINIADSAVKTTQLRKVYTVLVEFPNPNVNVDPGFEFLIGDADAVLINVGAINEPEETQNVNGYYETVLSIQTPPVTLDINIGDTLDIGNVPYTVLAVIGVSDTQNVFTLKPQVTLNDQLQYYYLTTGDEVKTLSGNGLDAYFFPSSEVNPLINSVNNALDVINHPLNNNNPLLYGPFDFWDNGSFWLDRKIFDTNRFNDTAGGIYWEGYINSDPLTAESVSSYSVLTNGYFMADYYNEDTQAWTNISRLAPTNIDVQHSFRRNIADELTGEVIVGFASQLNVLPTVMFAEGIFHKVIEDDVETTPPDSRVFATVRPIDSTEAFEAGLDPVQARLYSVLTLIPAQIGLEGVDLVGDVVISQQLYTALRNKYFADNAELDPPPEYFPGRYYVTTDIPTSLLGSSSFTISTFPISDNDTTAKTARFSIPRTLHYLEVNKIRFTAWWPQILQGWDEKLLVFTNVSNVYESSFSVFNKTYEPDQVPFNRESLNNTFINASKRGSNILEEGLNIENTLRVTAIPPTVYRHTIGTEDVRRTTLDDPRHDFEFNNLIPNYFGSPGVGVYELPIGPFQAEKSIRNLTIRPGEFVVNLWHENFYNTKHVGSDPERGENPIGLNCIDQISPAELIRISRPTTSFLDPVDETQYDPNGAAIYYSGIDVLDFSSRFAYDARPFYSAFKALSTNYSSLLDDAPGIGAIIGQDSIEAHNNYAQQIFSSDERWIRHQFNVTGDIGALPYVGLGSERHFNVVQGVPELPVTYFGGAVAGSDLGQFQQLSVPNINLVDIVATKHDEGKFALAGGGRNYTYKSILVDPDSTLGSKFIKKDNFAVGFKTYSDLLYSPYFTTTRRVGTVSGGTITSPNHGFEDRQIVVYHDSTSDDNDWIVVRKYVQFVNESGEYEVRDQPLNNDFPSAPINIVVDGNERLSNYQRKALVTNPTTNDFSLVRVKVRPLDQPKFYLDNDDSIEVAVRYLRDVSSLPLAAFTEAQYEAVTVPGSTTVVDLVEYDDDSFPESVLGVSLYNKFDLETDVLNIRPYFPTIGFRETVVAAQNAIIGYQFKIISSGNTDFTLMGSPSNTAGTVFTVTDTSSAVGTTGTVRRWMGFDESANEVIDVLLQDVQNPISTLEAVIFNGTGTTTYPFAYPERILDNVPSGWILQITSQTYTKQSVLEPILNQNDNRLQYNASNFFVNGVPRIETRIFDPANSELEQDPNPYDLPISGTWNIQAGQFPAYTNGSYVVGDTFEGAPVGPVTDELSSPENLYLDLGPSEVYLEDTRPLNWNELNGDEAPDFVLTTPNGKLFVQYESSVFGKLVDKDDSGYSPGAIQAIIDGLIEQYGTTGSISEPYNLNVPNRLTKYMNTPYTKSTKNGIYGPFESGTSLPVAIKDVTQLPDGSVELEFSNFNNIPANQLFLNHNGWEQSGILRDPWATEFVAIYSDKSVVDYSKLTYCQNVIPLEATLGANAGATQILVPTGVAQNGYFIQFAGYVTPGTTIINVATASPYDTITISAPLLKTLEPGYVITSAPDNLRDYELCTLTLNTAPPFEGTEKGLATTTNAPELEVAELVFESLEIKGSVATPITTETTATQSLTINYVDDQLVKTPYKLISL